MNSLNPNKIKKYFKNQKPADIKELRKNKEKYNDPYFKPNENSLYSKKEDGSYVDSELGEMQYDFLKEDLSELTEPLVWKRVTEKYKKWEIFEGKIEFDDVKQGNLGDCYFLACLSALTEFPYIIREKFRTTEFNEEGYYEMIFFIDGEWQIVFVDDYFPYTNEQDNFAFLRPQNNELWAMLLEKAWAKVNGGYSNIIAGHVSEAIQALTGFPTDLMYHDDYDAMDIFKKVLQADKQGTVMSSGSRKGNKVVSKGLVESHAYTLIEAKEYKQKDIYLLKLRNPWGSDEWSGTWGDSSKKWTEELKEYFGYIKKDDGIFWIDFENYWKFFMNTYICYILYGAVVKTYHFEYTKYLENPAVFNIEIPEKSKTSISAFFKGSRFNRDLHNVNHPYVLVLCKYNNKEIQNFYIKCTFTEDISLVEDLEPGQYVLWSYCSYKNVTNDDKFFFSLNISSKCDLKIEFVGLDQNFLLIQHLLLENYKVYGANNIESSRDYFIGSDQIPAKNGLFNKLIYNKSDKWLEINISVRNSSKNIRHLPPYEDMDNFSVTIPPKQSAAIIAMKLDKKSFLSYTISDSLIDKDTPIPPENNFDNLLLTEIDNSSNNGVGIREETFKYVAQDKVNSIPTFNEISFDPKKLIELSLEKEEFSKTLLEKQYPFEMQYLEKNFPLENKESWGKLDIPEEGLYIGQIDKEGYMHGKGIFLWNEKKAKYIGYIDKGKMDKKGVILTLDNKIIYEGEYKRGKLDGKGKLYISEEEYYEGEFKENEMNGKGKYHFKDGSIWEGEFKNNKKEGIGIMSYTNTENKYFVEYENDHFISKVKINENEIELLKESSTENQFKKLQKDIITEIFKKKDNRGAIIQKTEKAIEETAEQKLHREFLETIDKFKKDEPFMLQQVLELFKVSGTVDNFKLIVYNKETKERYLGNVGKDSERHGRGAYFDGETYNIGYFNHGYPNGYFKKYSKNKTIIFKGFVNKDGQLLVGKIFHSNGDIYKGTFKNNVADGYGTYFFSNGASWTGRFSQGVFNGTGKYFYDNGVLTEIVTYADNKIVNRSPKQREDYLRNNSKMFFNSVCATNPGVIEHILLYPPYKEHMYNVHWVQLYLKDGSYYFGEFEENGEYNGRCCIMYPKPIKRRRYYVGYIIKGYINKYGSYYDDNWRLLYIGEFKDNTINGYGIEYYPNGDKYCGFFVKGLYNGLGVYHKANGDRVEGNFLNGYYQDLCYIITQKYTKKQEVKFNHGNIVEQKDFEYCNKYAYQKKSTLNSLATVLLNKKQFDLAFAFKQTEDNCVLTQKAEQNEIGLYVGEVNNIGFRHGRGYQGIHNSKEFYIGYFQDNIKSGKGKIFYEPGKIKYDGYFLYDMPYGQGKYFYNDGSTLEGNFNEIGQGSGVFIFPNGESWKGTFYGWNRHGSGEYFDKNGNSLGMRSFQFNYKI